MTKSNTSEVIQPVSVSTTREDQLDMVESVMPTNYWVLMNFLIRTKLSSTARMSAGFFVGRMRETLDTEAFYECTEVLLSRIPDYFEDRNEFGDLEDVEEASFLLGLYEHLRDCE